VPTDFLNEWEEGTLYWKLTTATKYTRLNKDDYDYLTDLYSTGTDGPRGYALAGDYFLIVPEPTVVYDWKMRYFAHQPINVADDDENKWLKYAANWLIAETGLVIATNYLNNDKAASAFEAWRREAKRRLEKFNIAREEANRERMMGE